MILYRDQRLAVVNKPSGLLVHRGWARDRDVLMMRVRDAVGTRVYPVHRLDRGASGVVLFALDREAAKAASQLFERRTVVKNYFALVRGVPREAHLRIEHPISRTEGGSRVAAVTDVQRLEVFGRYSWVHAQPLTGRMHQIRRHLKHVSCPLIGDVRYGKGVHNRLFRSECDLHRLALHASSLQLRHPFTGQTLNICAPLPADLSRALTHLRRHNGLHPTHVRV